MTAATTWPPRPPDRVRHRWSCTRTGPTVETVRTDATGHARVVLMCQQCGGSDLVDRVRVEVAERGGAS